MGCLNKLTLLPPLPPPPASLYRNRPGLLFLDVNQERVVSDLHLIQTHHEESCHLRFFHHVLVYSLASTTRAVLTIQSTEDDSECIDFLQVNTEH